MAPWTLEYEQFDPAQEKLREALCTLGNGYFCTRGAATEASAGEVHYPGTYLAGGYNRLKTEIAGEVLENEDLVNLPNWLPLSFRLGDGEWFDLQQVQIIEYRQVLAMQQGVLRRSVRFQNPEGHILALDEERLVHMRNPHLAAIKMRLRIEKGGGEIEFRSALDGRVINDGVARYRRLNSRHLEPLKAKEIDGETLFLQVETNQSKRRIALAARTRIRKNGETMAPERTLQDETDYVGHLFRLPVRDGDEIVLEKVVALFNSNDKALSESGADACQEIVRSGSFEALRKAHVCRWEQLWRRFDLDLEMNDGNEDERRILRLHIFHLLQTVSPHTMDLDVGVPSRGWHGEGYRGHILWDELFIFPYLNLRFPEITRALLQYRYRRLQEACAAARQAGYRGAMYPWQSGSNGREESQQIHLNPQSGRWIPDHTHLQRHVNAAIAYNVWQYYQATRDGEFLSFYGAEMMLEIARFWASLAVWNQELERFEIVGVMGPDEYHDAYPDSVEQGLRNNSYTNVLASWVLTTALEVLEALSEDRREELCETLELAEEELRLWERISRRLRVVFHDDGILSQFEGYEQLEELDWERYRREHGPVMRLDRILEAEGDSPNRYKASKQADVLMLFYLFSAEELEKIFHRLDYPFSGEIIPKNIDYYMERTSHGSTLSQVVHSWILARVDRPRAWKFFQRALRIDIEDVQGGTTPEGIHLGAMASTVDLVQRGFTGIVMRGDTLHFNPRLPEKMRRLEFRIHYRGQSMQITITQEKLTISCVKCTEKPIRICYLEEACTLEGGQEKVFSLT